MSAKTPQEQARQAASRALLDLAKYYAGAGIPAINCPLPAELEAPADELRALDGLSVLKLVIERQQFLPFSDR
jgi:hypothetical protein